MACKRSSVQMQMLQNRCSANNEEARKARCNYTHTSWQSWKELSRAALLCIGVND